MSEWKEHAEPVMHEGKTQLRLIQRGTFKELIIYMDADDDVIRPFAEALKKVATVDLHGHPPGQGDMWPEGCAKIRIRMEQV